MESQSSSKLLVRAFKFLKPYKKQIVWASIALIFTAGLNLALVQYVRIIVDQGFVASSLASLGRAITGFLIIAILQAIGTFARFYWVSWLGERVTANRFSTRHHENSFNPESFRRIDGLGRLTLNEGIGKEIITDLVKRGHKVSMTGGPIANPVMIYFDREKKEFFAAGDPKANRHAAVLESNSK